MLRSPEVVAEARLWWRMAIILEGEEDDALCPHLLQLRRGVGRRGRRRGWKHLLSVELSRLGSILLLFLVFLITRYM